MCLEREKISDRALPCRKTRVCCLPFLSSLLGVVLISLPRPPWQIRHASVHSQEIHSLNGIPDVYSTWGMCLRIKYPSVSTFSDIVNDLYLGRPFMGIDDGKASFCISWIEFGIPKDFRRIWFISCSSRARATTSVINSSSMDFGTKYCRRGRQRKVAVP